MNLYSYKCCADILNETKHEAYKLLFQHKYGVPFINSKIISPI